MKKRIIDLLLIMAVFINPCVIAVAEDNRLIDSCSLSGDILTVSGYGENVSLFLLNPNKTKEDMGSIANEEEYLNTVNYSAIYNTNFSGSYSDTIKINNLSVGDDYLLCVKDNSSEESIVIKTLNKLYVSLQGNDETGDGSESNPFRTVEKARDTIRSMDKTNPIEVIIRGGEYKLTSGLTFEEQDSGTESAPITYKAAEGEKVIFSGGREFDISKIKKVTDGNILGRVNSETAPHLVEIDLAAEGIDKNYFNYDHAFIDPRRVEIYLNGEQQNVARWPNEGYATIKSVSDNSVTINELDSLRAERWKTADKMYVEGYLGVNWYGEWISAGCSAGDASVINLSTTPAYGIKAGNRIAAANLLEELDSPGEWYVDSEKMKLYYYPPHELTADDTFEIATLYDNFVSLNEVKNIGFKGIEFNLNVNNNLTERQYALTHVVGNGFSIVSCDSVAIKDCIIKNIGTDGVFIFQSNNISVDGCIIHNTGYRGIDVKKCFESGTLNGCNIKITNNIISKAVNDAGDNGNSGILIESGTGVLIENNILHNMKNSAIRYQGNNHIIQNNEIYNCVYKTADAGAIYAGRSWTEYGTKILGNYFHMIGSGINEAQTSAVFWDDYHSGNTFEGNIVDMGDKLYTSGVKIGGGRDNIVNNNTFINGTYGVFGEDRIITYTDDFYNGYAFQSFKNAANSTVTDAKSITNEDWLADFVSQFPTIMTNHSNLLAKTYTRSNTVSGNKTFNNSGIYLPLFMNGSSTKENNTAVSENPMSGISLERIGVGDKTMIPDEMKHFELIYPGNNENVSNANVTFKWSESDFADEYIYEIASDKDFNNIVYSGTTQASSVTFGEINEGEYYWRVTAVNKSGIIGESVLCNEPYRFKAEKKAVVLGAAMNDNSIVYTVENNKDTNQILTVIAALKSADGKLTEVALDETKDIAGKTTCKYEFTTDFKQTGSQIELYLWDMKEGQRPIAVKYSFSK